MATKRWTGWAAVLAGGLILANAAAASKPASGSSVEKRAGEAFQWSRAIPAGKAIEIKGVNGDIVASRAAGQEVEVRATKHARKSDPDQVTIEVIEHEGGVTICAKYPDVDGKKNVCGPGDKGQMNTHNNDVRVDFEVRVPTGVRLIARTVNGEIRADALESPVEAATVNGAVRISTSGYASAETVNGSIAASLGSAEWTGPISFTTVNGRIDLRLPAKLDADVRAETTNGSIETDFPITVSGRFGKHRLRGTIGKGGRDLELETVNGNITLRPASQRI
jgi:hypothetical protein